MIFFLSKKFLSGKKKLLSTNSFLSILGILVGCIALTVVVAIMNGLQKDIINAMIEIDSYHIRITGESAKLVMEKNLTSDIYKVKDVKVAFPFSDNEAIIKTKSGRSINVLLKALPLNIFQIDEDFTKSILKASKSTILKKDEILMPTDMFYELKVKTDSVVNIMPIIQSNIFHPKTYSLKIQGVFSTELIDYNSLLVITSIDSDILENQDIMIGIKVRDKYKVKKVQDGIVSVLKQNGIPDIEHDISSWHEYNKATFSALSIEKNVMIILVSLIFLVVAINLGQNLNKLIYKKKNEIAILFSIGLPKYKIAISLILSSLIVGSVGSTFGVLFGIIIYRNLNAILKVVFQVGHSGYNFTYSLLSSIDPYVSNTDIAIIYFMPIVFCILFSLSSLSKLSKINVIDILKNDF